MTQIYNLKAAYLVASNFGTNGSSKFLMEPKQIEHETKFEIGTSKLSENEYEVTINLIISGRYSDDKKAVFTANSAFSGIFEIKGFSEEELSKIIRTHCAVALYPYARERVSNLINSSVFPQATLPIINFFDMYEQQEQQEREAEKEDEKESED